MTDDRRFWVLDPAGHRADWAEGLPEDGAVVEDGPFKGAEHIVLPPPDDPDDWVCDFCNTTILTRWGAEPFPVPMDGSYALCADHYEKIQSDPEEEFGEIIPGTRRGLWPAQLCSCGACFTQAAHWFPMLDRAYGLMTGKEAMNN